MMLSFFIMEAQKHSTKSVGQYFLLTKSEHGSKVSLGLVWLGGQIKNVHQSLGAALGPYSIELV